jgi:hypothetical protein
MNVMMGRIMIRFQHDAPAAVEGALEARDFAREVVVFAGI